MSSATVGVRFLDDSNNLECEWNAIKTVRQMLRVLSQLASDNVLAQPSVLSSIVLLITTFQVPNFIF